MVYTLLRDSRLHTHLQQKVLKRFIDKLTVKMREIEECESVVSTEIVNEMLSALKELTEITD